MIMLAVINNCWYRCWDVGELIIDVFNFIFWNSRKICDDWF